MLSSEAFYRNLSSRRTAVAVIGLGYAGLPLAVRMGRYFHVLGYDIDPERIRRLQQGEDTTGMVSPAALQECDIAFSCNPDLLAEASFYIVVVPTPTDADRRPDLSALRQASRTIGRYLKTGDYVVYESTVYPGCTEQCCIPLLESASGLKAGRDFKVGYSPERINPSDREHTLERTHKVVSGCDPQALDTLARIYGRVIEAGVFKASSIRVAEAAKILENTQRDVNIALMNECAILFSKLGIDLHETIEAASTKWNFANFQPGLVGGHCIGEDPYYLLEKAEKIGCDMPVTRSARKTNESMSRYVSRCLLEKMVSSGKAPEKSRILLMGLSYKENTPDLRNTKTLDLFRELKKHGLGVDIADPYVDRKRVQEVFGIPPVENPYAPYDAVAVCVAHDAYRKLDEAYFRSLLTPTGILADLKSIYHHRIRSLAYWSL